MKYLVNDKSKRKILGLTSVFYLRLIWFIGIFSLGFLIGCHKHQPVKPPHQEPTKYGGPPSGFIKNMDIERMIAENQIGDFKIQS